MAKFVWIEIWNLGFGPFQTNRLYQYLSILVALLGLGLFFDNEGLAKGKGRTFSKGTEDIISLGSHNTVKDEWWGVCEALAASILSAFGDLTSDYTIKRFFKAQRLLGSMLSHAMSGAWALFLFVWPSVLAEQITQPTAKEWGYILGTNCILVLWVLSLEFGISSSSRRFAESLTLPLVIPSAFVVDGLVNGWEVTWARTAGALLIIGAGLTIQYKSSYHNDADTTYDNGTPDNGMVEMKPRNTVDDYYSEHQGF